MADRHSNQQITALTGAFSDPRVILVHMDDSRLGSLPMSECHIEQSLVRPGFRSCNGQFAGHLAQGRALEAIAAHLALGAVHFSSLICG